MPNFPAIKIVSLALLIVACAASSARAAIRDLAPADEYFGRLRMSVLGIHNALVLLERRAEAGNRRLVPGFKAQLGLIDDAIYDWRRHYPRDTWLRRTELERRRVTVLIGRDTMRG